MENFDQIAQSLSGKYKLAPQRVQVVRFKQLDPCLLCYGVIYVHASWSGPCVVASRILFETLSESPEAEFPIFVVDTDEIEGDRFERLFGIEPGGWGETIWLMNGRITDCSHGPPTNSLPDFFRRKVKHLIAEAENARTNEVIADSDLYNSVRIFVANVSSLPVQQIVSDTRLYHDLGLDGLDGEDVLTKFASQFEVDMFDFSFDRHFGPEGPFNPFTWLYWLVFERDKLNKRGTAYRMVPLSTLDLYEAAMSHKFPDLRDRKKE